jgi:hypothetical protein
MKIKKIGISLLIALCFILPTSAVMADPGNNDADTFVNTHQEPTEKERLPFGIAGRIDEFNNPVILQDTTTEIMGFYLEECDGDELWQVTPDVIIPFEDCYEPKFKLVTLDPPSHLEPELEIYLMNRDTEYCIYETSFEDNARNYLEWGQIDLDCGIPGGYYDGWSWSDARACGSDHSFKSTMYDEYKNMQDDILYLKDCIDLTADEFELCDGGTVEIDDVGMVNISFDIFVDGEHDDYMWNAYRTPLDYLIFGLMGEAPLYGQDVVTWLFMDSAGVFMSGQYIFPSTSWGTWDPEFGYDYTGFARKIDGCPGWWHVWANIDVDSLQNPDCFSPYFEWISDKERVYEGAYVDNVEINIIEDDGQKIYQGHSQDWIDIEVEGESWFEFPLDWDDDIEITVDFIDGIDEDDAYYKAICKIKDDTGGYNDWIEIDFEIGPYIDCAITDIMIEDDFTHDPIPDGGILQYPSDAHINFCFTNLGNDVMTDIPIKVTGYKVVEDELFFDDFEGPSMWQYFYDEYPLYISDDKAWSGSKSLAMNNPDTKHIVQADVPKSYIGYSQQYFDMEGVTEATIDWYYQAVLPPNTACDLMLLTYYYVVYIGGTFLDDTGSVDTPICVKTWIGPMQPQCNYLVYRNFKALFDLLAGYDYFVDENGHQTYETGIGFRMDTDSITQIIPDDCFDVGEPTWSGVYIDDISVKAKVMDEAVWTDTMVIPGPCEPGETCCAQFTWEDVPYSDYCIIVETLCEGDIHQAYPEEDSNNWAESCFIVLEDLEQASKVEGVDYTECEPEAWCISDVVGNDCGNDGAGDHYALATNCDTFTIPELVQDTITLADADAQQGIDISHLELAPAVAPPFEGYCQEIIEDVEGEAHGAFSNAYYRVYDNFDLGQEATIGAFSFYGLEAWYGDDSFVGDELLVGFYEDSGGAVGPEILDQTHIVGSGDQTYIMSWLGYSIWLVEGELGTPVDVPAVGWFSVNMPGFSGGYLAWIDGVGDGLAEQWYYGSPYNILDYDLAFCIYSELPYMSKAIDCYIALEESFECWEDGVTWPPPGWSNTGWLPDLYGDPEAPCDGDHWAFSWAAGDLLTSPVFTFGNYSTTLTFEYFAELSTHPMNLEVLVDGSVVWSDYGYTHTTCTVATIDLGNDGLPHTIGFRGMTSDFYGQILDNIIVENCDFYEDPIPPGDKIWVNFTYQVDMRDTMAEVILEVAPVEFIDGNNCAGCEDETGCPAGVDAWIPVISLSGHAPGICQNVSVEVGQYLGENATNFCLRFRLDSTDAIYEFPSPYYLEAWYDIPGIGFHLHEISISNIVYDEILGVSDFYEDFEDANFVEEESGFEWFIDCVTFGEHVQECDDFQFCISDECPVILPYECNDWTLRGEDSYGDGWDGYLDWIMDAFVSVWVNGVEVVDDFTVYGSSAEVTFEVCGGDEVYVLYETDNGFWEIEHSWTITDSYGEVWFSYDADAYGDNVPFTIDGTANIPAEILSMAGRFPAEPIDEAFVWETEIMDAYEAYLTGNWEYDFGAGITLTFELSADGGDNWFIIALVEGPAAAVKGPIPHTPFDLTP